MDTTQTVSARGTSCPSAESARPCPRSVACDTARAEAIKVVARAHKTLIGERTRPTQGLRHALREFFPAALEAFEDLAATDTLELFVHGPRSGLGGSIVEQPDLPDPRRGTTRHPGVGLAESAAAGRGPCARGAARSGVAWVVEMALRPSVESELSRRHSALSQRVLDRIPR